MRDHLIAMAVLLVACKPPAAGTKEADDAPAEAAAPETASEPITWDLPGTVTFKWGESWNMHHAFGASGATRFSEVVLSLDGEGVLHVVDAGKLKSSELSKDWGYKEEEATWENVWEGPGHMDGENMVFALDLVSRDCIHTRTDYGSEVKNPVTCPDEKSMTLTCRPQTLTVKPRIDEALEGAGPVQTEGWICHTEDPHEAPATPFAWFLSADGCLESGDGPGKGLRELHPCSDEPFPDF